ncbi:hypothetical protein BKP35_16030 [Anaerobacillus arseniciselenatis]|uniref:Integrase n=1 Tax=Anaerobacillus arseniciselenatis TaxID=85682 RepID=A0A1S2LE31_9BACI|nr:tyrosine-type recombinase/integrase [Anaerobacillus arseniciselenatis]OIJ09987.1 hypothetical protein BKP35_16030 [Anaerobacillus arseniciselenatis]
MEIIQSSTLPSFAQHYLLSLVKKNRKASTIKRYLYDLEDFFVWLQIEKKSQSFSTWAQLTPRDIEQYLDILTSSRKYQPRTTKRIITVLNQLYKYYDNQGLSKNPITKIHQIEIGEPRLNENDFIKGKEIKQLLPSIRSLEGLTNNQIKKRHLIASRNESIITLFLKYGLTLKELTNITMTDLHFETNSLIIPSNDRQREIKLSIAHKHLLYDYYEKIPKPVRPRYHENDPFFVAFDFQRGTYRWVYEEDKPKRLTDIAVQRMIQKEVKRSGLRKGISAQHLRNTFILSKIDEGVSMKTLQQLLGLKTDISLKMYFNFYDSDRKARGRGS